MFNDHELWSRALKEIEAETSKANFNTWFKNTNIKNQEDGIVFVSVPNTFVRDWLATKYHKTILRSIRNIEDGVRGIEYVISRPEDRNRARPTEAEREPVGAGLGLNELYINRDSNLNPKYSVDSLVVGSFNELAHAAAQAVINSPGLAYNPLFVYGPTGVGKTHLIQGVGNQIAATFPSKKVFYTTSENFTVEYVSSVTSNRTAQFKEKFRKHDVLIIDDVQFFSGKEKSQEELFHLFNHYHEKNKQIIFTSDKSPKFIPNLEERLRSRFEGGMIVDINKPDYESRLAILKSKATKLGFNPYEEVLEYLASMVQDSIRELEGALNTIIIHSQTKKRNVSLAEVKTLIKHSIKPQKTVSIKDIMRVVAEFYNIEEKSLLEKTRRKEVVKPRQIIMFILREDFNTSYPYIGQKLGGRDHTTVIHACNKIKADSKKDSLLSQELDQIRSMLYAAG